jgi:hypothetical protein
VIRKLVAVALVLALFVLPGCQQTVEVKTGTRIVCPYGHTDSSGVKTLKVPAEKVGEYQVTSEVRVCAMHAQAEKDYAAAQSAIASGDLTAAKAKLETVVKADPKFKKAASQLDEISKGGKPKPDSSGTNGGGGGDKPTSENPAPPASSELARWTPDAIEGWTAEPRGIDAVSVSREYLPAGGQKAVNLVISAEVFRTAKDAKAAVRNQIASAYTKDAATFTVKGRSITYGTDGRQFATAGFTSGPVMIAVQIAADGVDPNSLRPALEDALSRLP